MPPVTRAKQRQTAMTYARAIIQDGKSQVLAYKTAFPNAQDSTAASNAPSYNRHEVTQRALEIVQRAVTEKITNKIAQKMLKDAVNAKRTVVYNSKGDTLQVEDNATRVASREQFFKVIGHPGFVKSINTYVDNRQVNIDTDTAREFVDAVESLQDVSLSDCDQAGYE